MQDRTAWKEVSLIIVAGIIGAFQIGKVAIAVPLLRDDLGLSLFAVSWVAGAYAALGVFGGMAAGFILSYFPLRRVIIAGLGLIAIGNFLGAAAPDATLLIASRVLEGIGFLAMVISCPTLLRSLVTPRTQQIVFACWSAYMPVGAALMLLAGPSIMRGDWRWLWILNGGLAAIHALAMILARPKADQATTRPQRPTMQDVHAVFASGGPVLLTAAFTLYTIQYFALSTFLPTFLVERLGLTLAAAGTVSALALCANAVGNISAGFILRLGAPLWTVFAFVFGAIGLSGVAIFANTSPVFVATTAAALCLGLSALLPASVIITMPRLVGSPQRLALSMGMIQQASSVGQLGGPAILAFWIEWQGWGGVPYMFGVIAITGLAIAALTRRIVRPG